MENFKQSKSKKGYLYLLTPKGIKEKKVITLNFIRRKMDEYERLEREIGKARQEIGKERGCLIPILDHKTSDVLNKKAIIIIG
jgi:hypothetical protein